MAREQVVAQIQDCWRRGFHDWQDCYRSRCRQQDEVHKCQGNHDQVNQGFRKEGQVVFLNAKVTKVDTKKSFLSAKHAPKLRYEASNDKIKVASNGKVKGVKKGTVYIYIYAKNLRQRDAAVCG